MSLSDSSDVWKNQEYPAIELHKTSTGFFKLLPDDLPLLDNFKNIRIYCTNPVDKRVLHVMSSDTENGKYLFDWFRLATDERKIENDNARCRDAIIKLENDNSSLSQECTSIGMKKHEFLPGRMYGSLIYSSTKVFKVWPWQEMCDSDTYHYKGSWQFYLW